MENKQTTAKPSAKKMDAQMIIDNADNTKFNPRSFRSEMNLAGLINATIKQWEQNG